MFVQKVLVPPLRPPPQLAADLGALAAQLVRIGLAGGAWLGASLARRRVDRAARRAARRACEERAELMAMARRYAPTQPEFAKDLVAAASRDR